MSIVSVDLAMKMSAAVITDDDGEVIDQADSWRLSEDEFLNWITRPFASTRLGFITFGQTEWLTPPDVLVIEDLDAGVPFMKITKKVCQLQGRIIEKMYRYGAQSKMLMLPPSVWQRYFKINGKGAAKLVQPKAEELVYTPPIDFTQFHGKERQDARKSNTDYCSAWLINRWAREYYKEHGTYDAPQTSRVI